MPITREQLAEILKRLVPVPDQMGPGTSIPSQGPVPENLFPVEKMGTLPQGLPDLMPDATNAPDPAIPGDHSTRNKILALLGGVGGVGLGAALGGKNFMGGLAQGIQPIPGIIMQNKAMNQTKAIKELDRKAASDRVLQTDKLSDDRGKGLAKFKEDLVRNRPLTPDQLSEEWKLQFAKKHGYWPDTGPQKDTKPVKEDIRADANGIPRFVKTGLPVYPGIDKDIRSQNIPSSIVDSVVKFRIVNRDLGEALKYLDPKSKNNVRDDMGRLSGTGTKIWSSITGKGGISSNMVKFQSLLNLAAKHQIYAETGKQAGIKEIEDWKKSQFGDITTDPDALRQQLQTIYDTNDATVSGYMNFDRTGGKEKTTEPALSSENPFLKLKK